MKPFRMFAFAAVVLATAPVLAAEDLTIVSKVTGGKSPERISTQYVTADKLMHSDGEQDIIIDYKSGHMTTVDHRKKEYYETSVEEMAAFLADLGKQFQGNPIMEKMMGGPLGEVTVKKGTNPRKIAGYACEDYTLTMGENMTFDIWATTELTPPAQYFDAFKAQYAAMGPIGKRFEMMAEEMRKLKGFPLATNVHMKMLMMNLDTTSEATEVKRDPVPASVFEVPKGYKKKDAPFKAMKKAG